MSAPRFYSGDSSGVQVAQSSPVSVQVIGLEFRKLRLSFSLVLYHKGSVKGFAYQMSIIAEFVYHSWKFAYHFDPIELVTLLTSSVESLLIM